MADPRFFTKSAPHHTLGALAAHIDVALPSGADATLAISEITSLENAKAGEMSFITDKKHLPELATCKASVVLLHSDLATHCPAHSIPLVCDTPYVAMARIMGFFYPQAALARPMPGDLQEGHQIHPTAKLEDNVAVAHGALIGPHAEIGRNTSIGANSVIGHGVSIGRDCTIAPNTTIGYALIGDRVIIHAGTVIGADGFGFAPGETHTKIPHLGRVIIQSDVDIGTHTAIDRGTYEDTSIGEGTKIDNQVQIAHNCVIGRHCFLAGQVGLAGSTHIEDYVQMGGRAGSGGHLTIGKGSVMAGTSVAFSSLPPHSKVAGAPARPVSEYYRNMAFLNRLRKKSTL